MIGNALGDGKPKNNTENPQTETFQEKYRKQLKKDINLDEEEEEEDENKETEAEGSEGNKEEEKVNFDDDEEFVSSKDMFDEM